MIAAPGHDPDMVLLRVKACGVCGSDLRYFEGENPWALHTLGREVPNEPNIVLGHEFVGRVVDGPAAWRGARVVGEINFACGRCAFCSTGRMLTPCLLISVMMRKISSTSMGASPSDGSSRSMILGADISPRPMASICCSPPESVPAVWSRRSPRMGNI